VLLLICIASFLLISLSFSTLLDLLADRKLDGSWSGEIHFNHGPRSKYFNRDSAYILQDDLHFATLTVRESIYYSACFRLPEGTSTEFINNRVNELLSLMGLSHVENTLVGDATHKGISGGQMKRLSIATEIVSLPELIFLDEPTSGLDSTMALEVMSTVKQLSQQNRTCISTIHQPSPEVFELFDKVVLLCEGKLIYYGNSKYVIDYFSKEPLNYYFENGSNPAEFIIDIGESIIKPMNAEKPLSIEELEKAYLNSPYRYIPPSKEAIQLALTNKREQEEKDRQRGATLTRRTKRIRLRRHATTSWTQFKLLTNRNILAMIRDIPEINAQLAKNVIVGTLIGVIFYQQAKTTKPLFNVLGIPNPEVQNISSLLFFATMFTMMSNAQGWFLISL
jgi:ABC-type multidrug transport system ATPase subunit